MNNQILLIFVIQIIMCAFAGLFYVTYINNNKDEQTYLEYIEEEDATTFLKKFGNWILIFGNFVPISLLVTLEFVRFFQAYLIQNDEA